MEDNFETKKKIYSWEILSDTKIIKHCDKSVFKYAGTGIPKQMRFFFKNRNTSDKIIKLFYDDKKYQARISEFAGRKQLRWKQDLQKKLFDFNKIYNNAILIFTKTGAGYKLELVSESLIDLDTEIGISEGKENQVVTKQYERSPILRKKAILYHGTTCLICGFNFEKAYGSLGKDFIEVHHINPLASQKEERLIDPKTDLICVCANCHRMLHRNKNKVLAPEQLKSLLNKI